MKTFRLNQIEQYVLEHGTVSMDSLCKNFAVSINTIRSDIATLVEKGSVRKIYGGVSSNQSSSLVPFGARKLQNLSAKQAIGRAAAQYIESGDIIYVDSGTTTVHIIEHIEPSKQVTVLTNNLNAINASVGMKNLEVISLPGKLDNRANSFLATDTARMLERYNIKLSFMAVTGVSNAGALTNSSMLEYEVKRVAVEKSERSFLLADSTKFGKASLVTYATLEQMYCVISDTDLDQQYLELCQQRDIELKLI